MFYYLYEIRNNLNGKIYVGVHKTKDMDDGYMGSGKIIRSAMEKHGIANFSKVILETFENAEAMYAREAEVVTDEFLSRDDVYNLRRGGFGGFDYLNNGDAEHRDRAKRGYKASLAKMDLKEVSKKGLAAQRERKVGIYSESYVSTFASNRAIQQLGNSPEARKKAAASQRETYSRTGHSKGEKNSQYGTMWITNGNESKKIGSSDDIPDGWKKGRVISKI